MNNPLKKVITCFLPLFLGVLCAGVGADDKSTINELNSLLRDMSSLHAKFRQVTRDEKGDVLQEDVGELKAKRPGLFKSHITEPFEQLTIINQSNIWQYDPELETVSIKRVGSQSLELPTLLVSGDQKKIAETFQVTRVAKSAVANSGQVDSQSPITFHLVPLNENRVYEWMELSFENKKISEIKMFSSLGETTTILFSDLLVNVKLDDAEFVFTPPEGTDVLVDDQ